MPQRVKTEKHYKVLWADPFLYDDGGAYFRLSCSGKAGIYHEHLHGQAGNSADWHGHADNLSAPFLLVFALCYVDEPVRYVIMQFQMYSGKWIKPVSGEERRTIEDFRREHGIRIQKRDS